MGVTEYKVEGLEGMEERMQALAEGMAAQGGAAAVRAGLQVIRDRAELIARLRFTERTGRLFRGIVTSVKVYRNSVWGRVGLRGGGTTETDPFYGRFLELGWKHVGRAKMTHRRIAAREMLGLGGVRFGTRTKAGRESLRRIRALATTFGRPIKGRPFLGPAFDQAYQAAQEALTNKLHEILDRITGKAA